MPSDLCCHGKHLIVERSLTPTASVAAHLATASFFFPSSQLPDFELPLQQLQQLLLATSNFPMQSTSRSSARAWHLFWITAAHMFASLIQHRCFQNNATWRPPRRPSLHSVSPCHLLAFTFGFHISSRGYLYPSSGICPIHPKAYSSLLPLRLPPVTSCFKSQRRNASANRCAFVERGQCEVLRWLCQAGELESFEFVVADARIQIVASTSIRLNLFLQTKVIHIPLRVMSQLKYIIFIYLFYK